MKQKFKEAPSVSSNRLASADGSASGSPPG